MGRVLDVDRLIAVPSNVFDAMLERIAKAGARRTAHEVGLDRADIGDSRSLFAGPRIGKQTAVLPGFGAILLGLLAERAH
jgi:hypothetical protein